jgi:hypothetical protein
MFVRILKKFFQVPLGRFFVKPKGFLPTLK